MSVLDGTIANTALPTIGRDLGASAVASIWVVNAFQLAVAGSLLAFAALGQLRGPSRVYRAGVIVFVLGSLAQCARALPAGAHRRARLSRARRVGDHGDYACDPARHLPARTAGPRAGA